MQLQRKLMEEKEGAFEINDEEEELEENEDVQGNYYKNDEISYKKK